MLRVVVRYSFLPLGLLCLAMLPGMRWNTAVFAAENDEGNETSAEVDYVDLAARLIHDQHFDRALAMLDETSPTGPGVDSKRYFSLKGLAQLNLKNFEAAKSDFLAAIKHGQAEPLVRLYLAQAYWGLEDYGNTLNSLEQAGASVADNPAVWLMQSEAQWKVGKRAAAIGSLKDASSRFPANPAFDRMQLFYLIDMGLYVEATRVAERYLQRQDVKEVDYVAVGEALRAAGQGQRAQGVLEGARLKYPQSERITLQLAHAYLDKQQTLTAAMLFEDAARLKPEYTLEAAELYRQARMGSRALSLNARVSDQNAKAKQRLSLLLDLGRFEAVTAMLPKVTRLGLLNDENIRYALAYAFFKTNRFEQAEAQLKLIRQPELYESALQLRKAMESCRAAGWECTL